MALFCISYCMLNNKVADRASFYIHCQKIVSHRAFIWLASKMQKKKKKSSGFPKEVSKGFPQNKFTLPNPDQTSLSSG